jgi:hypothetical protein
MNVDELAFIIHPLQVVILKNVTVHAGLEIMLYICIYQMLGLNLS